MHCLSSCSLFFQIHRPQPKSTLFPYTTLFRSFVNLLDEATEDEEDMLDLAFGLTATSDRKSTRLNSSHVKISYAVFCLKKKSTEYAAGGGTICSRHWGCQGFTVWSGYAAAYH